MGFFDPPDSEPDGRFDAEETDDGVDGVRQAPWIAGVVPIELLVAGSDQAAVVLGRVAAYPDGFELTVKSYLHRSVRLRRRRHLPMMLDDLAEPGEPIPDEVLRLGLGWPDGGRATNLGWDRAGPDETEPTHGLEPWGGGGSDREYAQEYWAWPLPDQGPLLIVVEWPAFGIEETIAPVDGALLTEAAGRSRPVWPNEPTATSHRSQWSLRTGHTHGSGEPSGIQDL